MVRLKFFILLQWLSHVILAEYPPVIDQQLANWERSEDDRYRRSFNPYKTGKETANEMSRMLDDLLAGYDRLVRPGFTKWPITVVINLSINSMGPVDENTQVRELFSCFQACNLLWRIMQLNSVRGHANWVHRPTVGTLQAFDPKRRDLPKEQKKFIDSA